jgi:hypothetical protein
VHVLCQSSVYFHAADTELTSLSLPFAGPALSQSINLGDPSILQAHEAVRSGRAGWVVYSLSANNDLRVQEQGNDDQDEDAGLEELQEEFSDGK